jgi:hypothetical protein
MLSLLHVASTKEPKKKKKKEEVPVDLLINKIVK